MSDAQSIPLDSQLCFSLYGTTIAINRTYKPMLDALGVTYPQYLVLSVLWEEDGRGVGAIATRLDLEPSTITPLVKRLEAAGLVARARSPQDEREVRVSLTDAGAEVVGRTACLAEALLAKSGMGLGELAQLRDLVRDFRTKVAA